MKPCPKWFNITNIEYEVLDELKLPPPTALTKLNVDIDPICVRVAPSLQELNLNEALNIPLHTLAQTIIVGGRKLKYIHLELNSLQRIIGPIIFTEPPTGLKVYLKNNRLTCLAEDLFNHSMSTGTTLTFLDLSYNILGGQLAKDTNGTTFQYYRHLEVLNLTANGIKNLTGHVFLYNSDIIILNLSKNSLRRIEFEIDHMTNLSFLDLSFNLLPTINANMLDTFARLTARSGSKFTMNLNGNQIGRAHV